MLKGGTVDMINALNGKQVNEKRVHRFVAEFISCIYTGTALNLDKVMS